ncbi:MAG: hypothetical protein HKN12_07880 [Gemmatimonadetes bacterium]|nr:hypothetical protein [Gemmatimonadota bacterium]
MSRARSLASGTWLVLGTAFLGFCLGGLLGGRVFGSGMGVDRLADALGGAALGLLIGGLGGAALIPHLSPRGRTLTGTGAALVGGTALFIIRSLNS